jgi:hypothetical protein
MMPSSLEMIEVNMPLPTDAEQRADKTREIPEFANFSLPGVRDHVAELLGNIGRFDGIFTTYTKHDISHIDAMLKMLTWLVPPATAKKMTASDWLLIVLAIYLHDLGMLVTPEEFENRRENPEFRTWFESLDKTNEGKEYLARTHRMSPTEKERFFFQEFVRKGHAARIREWITGRHSRTWGTRVKPIADAIASLMEPLPSRFRKYLGDVCESHHANDLDRLEKYPLYAPCASDDQAAVNVQYASILLRSADLLHVTHDRTPSIMYQLVRLSGPKGVDEWDKQLGTFSVRPRKREIDGDDPESTLVQISADFREERPLFALQEYVTYANSQVAQSKRWADKSQLDPNARNYLFPWSGVKGDVQLEGVPPRPLKFELDRGRLLDLLVGHTIYNDPTVAIRELLQNAIDAVRYQHHLASRASPAAGRRRPEIGGVRVTWQPDDRILVVEDNGVGMDEDVIKHHLMTVGVSFYNTPQFEAEHGDFSPISRFGIGILTCFMVSDDIEIVTNRDGKGYRIKMTSVHADYLLRELLPHDEKVLGIEPHGTRVTLRLRDTIDLSKKGIADIVRYWVIIPACKVEYVEVGKAPENIGVRSAEDALRQMNNANLGDGTSQSRRNTEIVVKSRSQAESLAKYEVAFMVESLWFWERSFAKSAKNDWPAVCIEGIRVSNVLPWFHGSNLNALLAVTGDRRFRTTVSRSGLEVDEDFERVAGLCAEMLFDHVRDEVKRIADGPGKPFSQASSASKWLFGSLTGSASNSPCRKLLNRSYDNLQSMVIERLHEDGTGSKVTKRSMLSRCELTEVPEFWTVESRLVDSLGLISRDLGRELSLNEFISALAPESKHLQYSPLMPDAHQFHASLELSHRVDFVQFSRKHQQAAIRWTRRRNEIKSTWLEPSEVFGQFLPEDVFGYLKLHTDNLVWDDEVRQHMSYVEMDPATFGHLNMLERAQPRTIRIEEAEIQGDDEQVQVVVSRLGSFLQSQCTLSRAWAAIRAHVLSIAQAKPSLPQLIDAFGAACTFSRVVVPRSNEKYNLRGAWAKSVGELRKALAIAKTDLYLPEELRNFSRDEWFFDASSYWRDWYKLP